MCAICYVREGGNLGFCRMETDENLGFAKTHQPPAAALQCSGRRARSSPARSCRHGQIAFQGPDVKSVQPHVVPIICFCESAQESPTVGDVNKNPRRKSTHYFSVSGMADSCGGSCGGGCGGNCGGSCGGNCGGSCGGSWAAAVAAAAGGAAAAAAAGAAAAGMVSSRTRVPRGGGGRCLGEATGPGDRRACLRRSRGRAGG